MSGEPHDQRLARVLARPLRHLPLTPNAITATSLVIGLAGAALLADGGRAQACWGGALFMLASFVDHVDGEFARLTGQTSRFGHYFDRFTAGTVYTATFVGIGIGVQDRVLHGWALPLGVAAGLSIALIFTLRNQVERRHGHDAIRQPTATGFEVEDCLYLIGPIAWLDWLTPFLVAAGIGAPLYLLLTVLRSRRGKA